MPVPDDRLSVHSVTFYGATRDELCSHWESIGLRRLSLIDTQLSDSGLASVVTAQGYSVESVFHLFESADGLRRVIDAAAEVGVRVVYMLTGGRGDHPWEEAAARFCEAVRPCVEHAHQAGVALAIENASGLYADIHIAHSLRDTIELAETAGLGVCVDLFHCWTEAHLPALLDRALPRTELIQLSDYVLGDRALPARAVPGDGAIPLRALVGQALAGGYPHGFDLELIGPRIEQEGRLEAARRACTAVSALLSRSGAQG
ncbi:sugar phosphate isomerase/epimerase family protein [Mycolicibacterium austroafricanum]|uniref:sugar phosphate isomerase/epimerase family protein n=1 Tax=Mycolicibacterium austroafricanum TaxID=39687 RepID=UPI0005690AB4|nr:TIM barrel protein [Mycolicibacterium austroafricanum]QZY44729.1 sugar phosphate isomerase/epimerase [Mycolicibacterium austroafricanum]